MAEEQTIQAILTLIHQHADAVNRQDYTLLRSTLALEDDAFREILSRIPYPIGSDVANDICSWLESNPAHRYQISFYDIEVIVLSDTIAYAIALNDWTRDDEQGSGRVTLVLKRYADQKWRILHLHRSVIPEGE